MDELPRLSNAPEEISIFCPVRLYLGHRSFDGLMDTIDSRGGTFYVLTDDEPSQPGSEPRLAMQRERRGELLLRGGDRDLRIPCRVRGMRFDDDGLYVYVGLNFLLDGEEKRRLESLIASLW
jgi:hypothetical protein